MHASFCITAYIHVHAHPHADDFIGATSVSVKALIAAYEARTDKSSPVVDFYRVVLKSANGKDVREKTSRTGYKAGQAPAAELHFHVKFDKTADLRESVADMTRAVNHIRGKHRLELKRKTGRLREGEVELRRWDEHSNTERWDKEATDLKTASVDGPQDRLRRGCL